MVSRRPRDRPQKPEVNCPQDARHPGKKTLRTSRTCVAREVGPAIRLTWASSADKSLHGPVRQGSGGIMRQNSRRSSGAEVSVVMAAIGIWR